MEFKAAFTREQEKLVADALVWVHQDYRKQVRELLRSWLMSVTPRPSIAYGDGVVTKIKEAQQRYLSEIDPSDQRLSVCGRISCERFFRETGIGCPDDEFLEGLSNADWLEAKIAFGYLALAWQAANFPDDILLTTHAMRVRYSPSA